MANVERFTLVRDETRQTSEAWSGVAEVRFTRKGCTVSRDAIGIPAGVHSFRFASEIEAREALTSMIAARVRDGFISAIKI